jgi:hypothetical protein
MTSTRIPVAQLPRTGGTDQLVTYAEAAGLRPTVQVDRDGRTTYAGTYKILLNGEGVDSPFGGILVGAKTGRILRGSLTFGNGGPTRTYLNATEVLSALRGLAVMPAATPAAGTPCDCKACLPGPRSVRWAA